MAKSQKCEYCIKTCPSDDAEALETLLNEMSASGWELYSMHEVDSDDGFSFNCIFIRDVVPSFESEDELSEITGFKTQMEKIMTSQNEPFEMCKDIQNKIKEKRAKISQIKSLIDSTPESERAGLNSEISRNLSDLEDLKQRMIKVISPEIMLSKIGEERVSISLSEEVINLINPDEGANLIAETVKIRQELSEKLGYIIPKIVFKDDENLLSNEFAINIRGIPAKKAFAYPGFLMYFKDDLAISRYPASTIKDVDIISGRKIVWIEESYTKDFWIKGKNSAEYIAECLKAVCIKYVDDVFDYNDMNNYVEIVGEHNLYLIENIIPDFLSIAEIKFILSSLIKEQVSIKDIVFIFEKLNDYYEEAGKEEILAKVRFSLARQISASIADENGVIKAFSLDEKKQEYLINRTKKNSEVVKLEASKVKKLVSSILKSADKYADKIKNIVIVVPAEIRYILFLVLAEAIPDIKVVSLEEISTDFSLEIVDYI